MQPLICLLIRLFSQTTHSGKLKPKVQLITISHRGHRAAVVPMWKVRGTGWTGSGGTTKQIKVWSETLNHVGKQLPRRQMVWSSHSEMLTHGEIPWRGGDYDCSSFQLERHKQFVVESNIVGFLPPSVWSQGTESHTYSEPSSADVRHPKTVCCVINRNGTIMSSNYSSFFNKNIKNKSQPHALQ